MTLPEELQRLLNQELTVVPRASLSKASEELSSRYRTHSRDKGKAYMSDTAHRLAYLAVRMPATYAVVRKVLEEVKMRLPEFSPRSLSDLGAGPGTGSWAAVAEFPEIAKVSLQEQDVNLIEIGQRMMKGSSYSSLQMATWHRGDLLQADEGQPQDLVVMSYVIGELPLEGLPKVISKVWVNTAQVLVVIEPGTPHGFERIRSVRRQLIQDGAFLVAPCPHANECPMSGGDWCHFSQRLERSGIHMAIKDVVMGYEDEKYSYVVAARRPVTLPEARVLRHPQHHTGHIEFTLCTKEGLEKRVLSRRHGELYKKARKWDWGDSI